MQEHGREGDEQDDGDRDEESVHALEDVLIRCETERARIDSEVARERFLAAVPEVVGERGDQRHRRDDGEDEADHAAALGPVQRRLRLGLRSRRHGYQTFISSPASGTPPSSVTSHVSCM